MAKLENVKTIDMVNGEITKVEYNGEIYAKVEGVPQKGDVALRIRLNYRAVTVGSFYVVTESLRGKLSYVDNGGDVMKLEGVTDRFAFFRKQSTPSATANLDERVSVLESKVATLEGEQGEEFITHNGAEYKLVDRKAQPGDVVVFIAHEGNDYLSNGKPYGPVSFRMTVVDNDGDDCLGVYAYDHNRTIDTVKVYEPVAQPLKVGDYAKVVIGYCEHKVGDLLLITELEHDGGHDFRVDRIGKDDYGYINARNIRKATDEEVAEAKAQAKWEKIGRKPNEFKKGDIVRYVGKASDNGSIVEVPEDSVQGWTKIVWGNRGRSTEKNSELELITPVESRFDRA